MTKITQYMCGGKILFLDGHINFVNPLLNKHIFRHHPDNKPLSFVTNPDSLNASVSV